MFEQEHPEFRKSWCRDVVWELPLQFSGRPVPEDIAVKTYGYATENASYRNDKLDFLNDSVVWAELEGYLVRCAQTYVDRLKGDCALQSEKKQLEDAYRIVAGDSPAGLMQEVENFLATTNIQ